MQFISQDMQPIAVVDGSGFHNLMAVAKPQFVVPSHTYCMQTEIPRLYVHSFVLATLEVPMEHTVENIGKL